MNIQFQYSEIITKFEETYPLHSAQGEDTPLLLAVELKMPPANEDAMSPIWITLGILIPSMLGVGVIALRTYKNATHNKRGSTRSSLSLRSRAWGVRAATVAHKAGTFLKTQGSRAFQSLVYRWGAWKTRGGAAARKAWELINAGRNLFIQTLRARSHAWKILATTSARKVGVSIKAWGNHSIQTLCEWKLCIATAMPLARKRLVACWHWLIQVLHVRLRALKASATVVAAKIRAYFKT